MQTHRKISIDDLDFYVNRQTGEAGVSLRGFASWLNQSERGTRRRLEATDEGKRYLTPIAGSRTKTGARVRYIPLQAAEAFASAWGLTPSICLQPTLELLMKALEGPQQTVSEAHHGQPLSITQVARELGFSTLVATADGCKYLGKLVKQRYLEARGSEPPRVASYYNGRASSKPAYYECDRALIEDAVSFAAQYLQEVAREAS